MATTAKRLLENKLQRKNLCGPSKHQESGTKKGNEFVGPKKQRHAKYLITLQDTPSRPAETAAAFLNRHEKRCKTFKKARGDRYSLKHQYTMHTHGTDKWHMLMHIRTQAIIIIVIGCCCGITFINMDLWLLFAVPLLYAVFLRMIAGRGQLEIVIYSEAKRRPRQPNGSNLSSSSSYHLAAVVVVVVEGNPRCDPTQGIQSCS